MKLAVESGLVVPVPAATPAVAPWRERLDPSADHGVPAHVTLLSPFVPPDAIDASVMRQLSELFARATPFDFVLESIGWFGDEIVYLAPEPSEQFVALTRSVMRTFPGYAPYSGAYREIIPHLTVGHGTLHELRRAAEAVAPALPIPAHAGDVWLMVGSSEPGRWSVRQRFPLGGRPSSSALAP
jgi:2'-5' RNA ligase